MCLFLFTPDVTHWAQPFSECVRITILGQTGGQQFGPLQPTSHASTAALHDLGSVPSPQELSIAFHLKEPCLKLRAQDPPADPLSLVSRAPCPAWSDLPYIQVSIHTLPPT